MVFFSREGNCDGRRRDNSTQLGGFDFGMPKTTKPGLSLSNSILPFVYHYMRPTGAPGRRRGPMSRKRSCARSPDPWVGLITIVDQVRSENGLISIARSRLSDFATEQKGQACGRGGHGCFADARLQQPARDDEEALEQEYRECLFRWAADKVRVEFEESTVAGAFGKPTLKGRELYRWSLRICRRPSKPYTLLGAVFWPD